MTEENNFNFIPLIAIIIIAFIFIFNIAISSSDSDAQFDCNNYQDELHKIARNPEDLIETHRATGVIQQIDENEKYYVVVINPVLWKQTTGEQRQLIRCSTTEIAQSKGKEGGIIDPIKKERLY